ncbi:hypothetical protein HHK36_018681 [Tetracentron sinense]|uniref:Nuclease HARBI1 n=1 Tax=Tetracentron sinense TaxID=13715 RepID=A0A834Z2M7_TETSI|nr:hypothetical protein HHK36_018681 [Tetracentron sinense]
MRMLEFGVVADVVNDYVRIGESTSIESLRRFVMAVLEVFGEEYLRSPNNDDISRLLAQGEARGFPGMLENIDYMHWKWKNCPVEWKDQNEREDHHDPSIILEVVASTIFFIYQPRPREEPPVSINGHYYTTGNYLADGIYPSWSTFVKTISSPRENKDKHFATIQESARKDIERAFGVFQMRFAIVREPSHFWDLPTLRDIMKACITMHNMKVEDEREVYILDLNYDVIDENIIVLHECLAAFRPAPTFFALVYFFSSIDSFLPSGFCTKSVFEASSSTRLMRISKVEGDDMSVKDFTVLLLNDDFCLLMSFIHFGWNLSIDSNNDQT